MLFIYIRMISRSLRHRAPLLWLVLPLVAGLLIGKLTEPRLPIWSSLLASVVFLSGSWYARSRAIIWSLLFLAGICCLGVAYYAIRRDRLRAWEQLPSRETHLRLRVERMFHPHPGSKNISGIARVIDAEPLLREIVGQLIYFSVRGPQVHSAPLPTEEFSAEGVLQPLSDGGPPASFDQFLESSGVNFRFDRGHWLSETKSPTAYRRFCAAVKKRLEENFRLGLEHHPELAALFRGILLGEPGDLSPDQHLVFVESGTMHLFAIAGLHIGAIALAIHVLLGLLRLPRVFRFCATVSLLWLFADVTGDTPSALRAVAMIVLVELAFLLRRPINPVGTLTFSALVALLVDPLQLFTASFQMSYGIVSSLLLLGLPLAENWTTQSAPFRRLPRTTWSWYHHTLFAV